VLFQLEPNVMPNDAANSAFGLKYVAHASTKTSRSASSALENLEVMIIARRKPFSTGKPIGIHILASSP